MSLTSRFAELWAELRAEPVVAPPSHITSHGPDTDPDEMISAESQSSPTWAAQGISGQRLVLEYRDSKGDFSTRQVICRRLDERAGVFYLSARCLLRDQLRAFRVDRIITVIDPSSGEVHEPAATFFAMFAPDTASSSRYHYGLHPRLYTDFNAGLNVLAFIARCDGKWHALEGEAISNFAASFWLRGEITTTLDEAAVAQHAARLAPDPETFWTSIERCLGNPVLRQIIRQHIAAVVDADGMLHPREAYWGRAVDEILSAA
ncbi:MAG: WYL domain-containing protein [Pseudomonas graminis]